MRIGSGRLAAIVRGTAVALLALTFAAPASAQFGGLKKKLKAAAASDAVERVAAPSADESPAGSTAAAPAASSTASPAAAAPAPGPAAATGGTIVLDDEVVGRLIAGLKAARAEREAARKADTPYGRYHRDQEAYRIAQPKCEAGREAFINRLAGNEKMGKKYNDLVENMVAAQGKGDHKLAAIYNDSAMAMQDPACVVKQPEQPDDYYEAHRAANDRAEQAALKASGYSRTDYAQALERVEMALRDGATGGLSASEKSAIDGRSKELKDLLDITPPPAPAPPPATARPEVQAPVPAAAQAAPAPSAAQQQMAMCYAQNTQKNEKRLTELAQRAQTARSAGDNATIFAIADTIQRIQSAGCAAGN